MRARGRLLHRLRLPGGPARPRAAQPQAAQPQAAGTQAGPGPDPASAFLTPAAIRRLTPKEAARAARILVTAGRHLLPGLVRRSSRNPERLAPRVRRAVVALGPPFIKLSQVVSSSPGLFPPALSDSLLSLLDDAPPEPWPDIGQAIVDGLGAPVASHFATVEPEPLAAASVAQVHGATLADGTPVVVKVRRPGVEASFRRDLRLLRALARVLERAWPAARVLNPVAIVDDTAAALAREMDFGLEAAAMTRFQANLAAYGDNARIRAPSPYPEHSGRGVLTMERVNGVRVDDLVAIGLSGVDALALLRAGVRAWIESVCEHGFFHGDVHAGNLMLDSTGQVVFLDFGIVGELDDRTRLLVRRGVVALLHRRDFAEVARCLSELGARLGYRGDLRAAAAAIGRLAEPLLAKPLSDIDYLAVLNDVIRVAAPRGVQLPRSIVLLFKQVIYFERYAKLLAPEWDILSDTYLIEFMLDDDQHSGAQGSGGDTGDARLVPGRGHDHEGRGTQSDRDQLPAPS